MNELRENDEVGDLIGDSRYIPFLHRIDESIFSLTVKWIINFIISVFEVFNFPAFVLLFIFFIEQIMQKYVDSKFKIDFSLNLYICIFGGWLLILFLLEKTQKNITSPSVFPVWFMNSKGILKNHFFSVEMARKYSADLDVFVKQQADEYIRQKIQFTVNRNQELMDLLDRMRNLEDFPNETFESLRRIIEILANVVVQPDNERNHFVNVMDRIMVEIANTKPIQKHIKQGSIMLFDEGQVLLRIQGHFNMPASVIEGKVVRIGSRFAGKVAEEGKIVWIPDVNNPTASEQYDFQPSSDRLYTGILGFPIKNQGASSNIPSNSYGVICLHFEEIDLQESELKVITKTLEVYAQAIISFIKIRDY